MTKTTSPLRDRELMQMLADEPELLALADALVETQQERLDTGPRLRRRPSRLPSVVATAAVAAAAVAVLLVAPWGGGDGGLVQRALAAVGTGPVLHVVIEQPVPQSMYDAVSLPSGTPIQASERREIWFDQSRGLEKTIGTLNGVPLFQSLETPQGGYSRDGDPYNLCVWNPTPPGLQLHARRTRTRPGRTCRGRHRRSKSPSPGSSIKYQSGPGLWRGDQDRDGAGGRPSGDLAADQRRQQGLHPGRGGRDRRLHLRARARPHPQHEPGAVHGDSDRHTGLRRLAVPRLPAREYPAHERHDRPRPPRSMRPRHRGRSAARPSGWDRPGTATSSPRSSNSSITADYAAQLRQAARPQSVSAVDLHLTRRPAAQPPAPTPCSSSGRRPDAAEGRRTCPAAVESSRPRESCSSTRTSTPATRRRTGL